MESDWVLIPIGFIAFVLLVGAGLFVVFQIQPDTPGGGHSDVESYHVGPEKPSPLNSSNVVDYTVAYEERLFYNGLVERNNHSLYNDGRVITHCTPLSVPNNSGDEFHVQLECRGGITDSSKLAESEEFTYSVTYRITTNTTQRTEFQNYPFEKDRSFNSERD